MLDLITVKELATTFLWFMTLGKPERGLAKIRTVKVYTFK